jgi:hypothetical protein
VKKPETGMTKCRREYEPSLPNFNRRERHAAHGELDQSNEVWCSDVRGAQARPATTGAGVAGRPKVPRL